MELWGPERPQDIKTQHQLPLMLRNYIRNALEIPQRPHEGAPLFSVRPGERQQFCEDQCLRDPADREDDGPPPWMWGIVVPVGLGQPALVELRKLSLMKTASRQERGEYALFS